SFVFRSRCPTWQSIASSSFRGRDGRSTGLPERLSTLSALRKSARTLTSFSTASPRRPSRRARSERPSMKREILINANPRETRVAIIEDDQLAELLVDRPEARRMVGDIYFGRVDAVLPGIQAAFIDIGTEKSAFLHASDLVYEDEEDPEDPDDDSDDEDADESGNG